MDKDNSKLEEGVNVEGVQQFINNKIDDLNSPTVNDLKTKTKLVALKQEQAFKNDYFHKGLELFNDLGIDIIEYCRNSCNPMELKDYKECTRNCVSKYLEQTRIMNRFDEKYAKDYQIESIYFNTSDVKTTFEKFSKIKSKSDGI